MGPADLRRRTPTCASGAFFVTVMLGTSLVWQLEHSGGAGSVTGREVGRVLRALIW